MNQIGLAIGGLAALSGAVMYAAAKPAQPVTTPAAFSERFPDELPHPLKKQDRLITVKPVAVAAVDIVDAGQVNAVDLTAPSEPAYELAQDDPPAPRRRQRNERNERDDRNVCTRHHLRKVWVTSRRWRCR